MSGIEIVQVRMKEQTREQVLRLQAKVHAPSFSDTIRRAIEISVLLINAVERGERIIIKSKDGRQREILISGLSDQK
ncbi:MAG: hypothetical protein K2Q14_01125 [Gammaproteobacteria bacterium]|nr:hypothetical protein [Gammaproteobacteria bacterium]